MHASDATAWMWKAAVLVVCIAIAVTARIVFQVVRASFVLQRQFCGPPSSSLLMGECVRGSTIQSMYTIAVVQPSCRMRCKHVRSAQHACKMASSGMLMWFLPSGAGNMKDFTKPDRHLLALDWANTHGQIVHLRLLWFHVRATKCQVAPPDLPSCLPSPATPRHLV